MIDPFGRHLTRYVNELREMLSPPDPTARPGIAGLRGPDLATFLFTTAAVTMLAWLAFESIRLGILSIGYPYQLENYGEGVVLNQARRLLSGLTLYPANVDPPYLATTYTPAYHFLVCVIERLFLHNLLAAGRFLSVTYTALTAVVIFLLVREMALETDARSPFVWLGALLAAFGFLSSENVIRWGPLMRIDIQAYFFSFLGLLVFFNTQPPSPKAYASLVPLVFAIFTRQTAVASLVACTIVSLFNWPKFGIRYALFAAAGIIFSYCAVALWEKHFWFQAVLLNLVQEMSWKDWWLMWRDKVLMPHLIFMLVAALYLFWALGLSPRRSWRIWTGCIYALLAFFTTFGAGKVGSAINYYLEHIGSFFILTGAFVSTVLAGMATPANRRSLRWIAVLTAFGLAFNASCTIWLFPSKTHRHRVKILEQHSVWEDERRMEDLLRKTPEPVLSTEAVLLDRTGHLFYFEPFILKQMVIKGYWNEEIILERVRHREFHLIVLPMSTYMGRKNPSILLTSEFISTVAQNYRLVLHTRAGWAYAPLPIEAQHPFFHSR